ncbi:MAG TPA: hypothetical protein VFN61_04865 [Acidimicrobiales bacterium]|nr:hypothetical protein [Acidimicrobiales bacterium]
MATTEAREGIALTHLDDLLFDGAGSTKRQLVDYLDRASSLILPELRGRPLSVIRAHRGEAPFMQKNLPKYAPEWLPRAEIWAEASHRQVAYALCNDRRSLMWFANQRAIEYHPALVRADDISVMTHLVIDLDPPDQSSFSAAAELARAVHEVLEGLDLRGAVKTSGSKGLHIWVPVYPLPVEHAAAATRALAVRTAKLAPQIATTALFKSERAGRVFVDSTRAGGATVVAAFSPRARPGVPVSFPVPWEDLDRVEPAQFDLSSLDLYADQARTWADGMPGPQHLPTDLVEEGLGIPAPRVAAMQEGRRRARGRQAGP